MYGKIEAVRTPEISCIRFEPAYIMPPTTNARNIRTPSFPGPFDSFSSSLLLAGAAVVVGVGVVVAVAMMSPEFSGSEKWNSLWPNYTGNISITLQSCESLMQELIGQD